MAVAPLYRENEEVRLGLENGDCGELVPLAVEVRVQGRVVCVVHPAEGRPAGGEA